MPTYRIESTVFDPIRFTTCTKIDDFIVDTWFDHAIITQNLFTRLPGLPTLGTGQIIASSGMGMTRPRVEIGVQINNIRALPITAYVVDSGPSDLLLGGDFLRLLFAMGLECPSDSPKATIEPPSKREKTALALRLLSEVGQFAITDIDKFIAALRNIHNCAVIVERGMYQHNDWPNIEREAAVIDAINRTITTDAYMSENDRLQITWIESGSIWITVRSGAKSGLTWLSQLFRQTMDAKLEKTISEATSAREKAKIAEMTREDIALAKKAEAELKTASAIRKAREEWRKTIIDEIDFRRVLSSKIQDKMVKAALEKQIDSAINNIAESGMLGLVEHLPDLPESEQHRLPLKKNANENNQRK